MWLLAVAAVAWSQTACPSRVDALDALETAVVTADFDPVEGLLADVVTTFGCGPVVTADQLARYWNLEGAYLEFTKDREAAMESFQAASRTSSEFPEVLGSRLQELWEDAPPAYGVGTVSVDPKPVWWTVSVDGVPVDALPKQVPSGLHLVQLGPSADDVRMAKVLYVRSDATSLVAHELQEGPAPAPPPVAKADVEKDLPPLWTTHTGIGAMVSVGSANGAEPAVKAGLPVEVGGIFRVGPSRAIWVRPHVGTAPALTGPWVVSSDLGPGEVGRSLAAALSVGGSNVQGDIGALLGYQWPGRATARIVAAFVIPGVPLAVEPRLGMNVGRGAEPAFEVVLAHRMVVFR